MGTRSWRHQRRDKREEAMQLAHEEAEPEVIVTKSGEPIDLRRPWPLPKQPEPKSKEQR